MAPLSPFIVVCVLILFVSGSRYALPASWCDLFHRHVPVACPCSSGSKCRASSTLHILGRQMLLSHKARTVSSSPDPSIMLIQCSSHRKRCSWSRLRLGHTPCKRRFPSHNTNVLRYPFHTSLVASKTPCGPFVFEGFHHVSPLCNVHSSCVPFLLGENSSEKSILILAFAIVFVKMWLACRLIHIEYRAERGAVDLSRSSLVVAARSWQAKGASFQCSDHKAPMCTSAGSYRSHRGDEKHCSAASFLAACEWCFPGRSPCVASCETQISFVTALIFY